MVVGALRTWFRSAVLPAFRSQDARVIGSVAVGVFGGTLWIARDGHRWLSSARDTGQQQPLVSVMTWNVLARPFTAYNRAAHRHTEAVEHPSQTRSRYTFAGMEITNRSTDLVFLQECEAAFFELDWNPSAAALLQMYDVYPCRQEPTPGTAVLVKKRGRAITKVNQPICIGGTHEAGGKSKMAAMLPVHAGSKEILAVSAHFTWDGNAEQRLHHVGLVGAQLDTRSSIVGGDFNCEPGENLEKLESSSFLGKLRRAKLPDGRMTGLTGDFSRGVCIDHVYVSPDLEVLSAQALGVPSSPFAGKRTKPAKISGPSDHVPVIVELL